MTQDIKLQRLIQQLLDGTLSRKYHWKKMNGFDNRAAPEFIKNDKGNNPIQPFMSYWYEDDKKLVGLFSASNNTHWITLLNKSKGVSDNLKIKVTDYYKLKTAIDNRIDIQDSLIDDFLED